MTMELLEFLIKYGGPAMVCFWFAFRLIYRMVDKTFEEKKELRENLKLCYMERSKELEKGFMALGASTKVQDESNRIQENIVDKLEKVLDRLPRGPL